MEVDPQIEFLYTHNKKFAPLSGLEFDFSSRDNNINLLLFAECQQKTRDSCSEEGLRCSGLSKPREY